MKRFFTFFFILLSIALFGQNLIPDGSAENYVECPSNFGDIETWLPTWQSFRGSPDYFNSCSSGLGWDNDLGYQEPRTGEGYLGLVTFENGLGSVREYLGIELSDFLTIGEAYYLTFFVSRAHQFNSLNLASNNIGALFMTENYLNPTEQGPSLNFSTFNEVNLVVDTVNWVEMTYQFVADSAYQYLAFGNFFDDDLTDTLRIGGQPTGAVISYYYFDDFCLTQNPNGCDFLNSTEIPIKPSLQIWPNPCTDYIMLESDSPILRLSLYNIYGEEFQIVHNFIDNVTRLNINLKSGMYLAIIETEKGKAKKRFMVSN